MIKVYSDIGRFREELKTFEEKKYIQLFVFSRGHRDWDIFGPGHPPEARGDHKENTAQEEKSDSFFDEFKGTDKFQDILNIVGKEHKKSAVYLDLSYQRQCACFLTRDTDHILKNKDRLEQLLAIKIFHADRDWNDFEHTVVPWAQRHISWIMAGMLLFVVFAVLYLGITQKRADDIMSRIDTGGFGIAWNNFDGEVKPLLVLAKITLGSLDYNVLKSEYDSKDNIGLIWASYRHQPKQDYPPIVKIRIQKLPLRGLALFYQGDKAYMPLKKPSLLPKPFSEKLYKLIRTEKYQVKEVVQQDHILYPLTVK